MKMLVQITAFILAASPLIYSQEFNSDSVQNIYHYDHLMHLQSRLEEFDMYLELNYMRMKLEKNNDQNTIWMWTKLSIARSGRTDFFPGESPVTMLEPLRRQFLENSKLNPVRYVLGMAQAAAVGYLAYQHIKKYGLFK